MAEIPITVRGDIEPRAVEQLRRCAEAGDAVAGAICADGHVGCPKHPNGRMVKRRGRVTEGAIDFDAVQRELAHDGVELRGAGAYEAPAAYKRLDAVLAAHGDTIEIVHRLTPIGIAMAGADTFDPYKD